jgi:hypothetical protein
MTIILEERILENDGKYGRTMKLEKKSEYFLSCQT